MMEELGIKEYEGYTLKSISSGTFLTLNNNYITSTLSDTYINDDLNKFMPAASLEVMIQFQKDIENLIFEELFNTYLAFIHKMT